MVVAFSASAQSGRESFFLWGGEGGWGSTAIASSHTQNNSERKSEARAPRERISQSRPRPSSLRGRDRFSGSEALFLAPPRRWRQPEAAAATAPVRARPRLKAAANYSTLVGKSTGKKRKNSTSFSLFSSLFLKTGPSAHPISQPSTATAADAEEAGAGCSPKLPGVADGERRRRRKFFSFQKF